MSCSSWWLVTNLSNLAFSFQVAQSKKWTCYIPYCCTKQPTSALRVKRTIMLLLTGIAPLVGRLWIKRQAWWQEMCIYWYFKLGSGSCKDEQRNIYPNWLACHQWTRVYCEVGFAVYRFKSFLLLNAALSAYKHRS